MGHRMPPLGRQIGRRGWGPRLHPMTSETKSSNSTPSGAHVGVRPAAGTPLGAMQSVAPVDVDAAAEAAEKPRKTRMRRLYGLRHDVLLRTGVDGRIAN